MIGEYLPLGVLLLAAAAGEWRKRPKAGEAPKVPGRMTKIDTLKPGAVLGLGGLV